MKTKITKAAFRQWAAAQPTTQTWDYYDNNNCPLAEFLKSLGHTNVRVGGTVWSSSATGTELARIPAAIQNALDKANREGRDTANAFTLTITQPALVRACR
jgi:hypothetical protein